MAVSWIEICSDDELTDYLPQLVQVPINTMQNVNIIVPIFSHLQQNIYNP